MTPTHKGSDYRIIAFVEGTGMVKINPFCRITPLCTEPIPGNPYHNALLRAHSEEIAQQEWASRGYPLTDEEQGSLADYENRIATSCRMFTTIAIAIFHIHREKLYRPYLSMYRYCEAKWKFTRNDTCRDKKAGEVLVELAEATTPPTLESQCRELAKLERGSRQEIWERLVSVSDEGRVTAADIAAAVAERVPRVRHSEQQSLLLELTHMTKTLRRLSAVPLTMDIVDKLDELAALIIMALDLALLER